MLPPGDYTIWIDSDDGTGGTYTLNYSFLIDPCTEVSCDGDLICSSLDWVATSCLCPEGTESSGEPSSCLPILPPLEIGVDIEIGNTCALSVSPDYIVVPADRVASITHTNHSADYHAKLDATPGVDNLSLPMGESWTDPTPWCLEGVSGWIDISASEGCSSIHRLHVTCLEE